MVNGFVIVVDHNKSFVAATEGNGIVIIVPPIGQHSISGNVTEFNHVINRTPPVLTNPFLIAGIVSISGDTNDLSVNVGGSDPIVMVYFTLDQFRLIIE